MTIKIDLIWIIVIVGAIALLIALVFHLLSVLTNHEDFSEDVEYWKRKSERLLIELEREKMARRVDASSSKIKDAITSLLEEVTDESGIALDAMAESLKAVKAKESQKNNPPKVSAEADDASRLMQVTKEA